MLSIVHPKPHLQLWGQSKHLVNKQVLELSPSKQTICNKILYQQLNPKDIISTQWQACWGILTGNSLCLVEQISLKHFLCQQLKGRKLRPTESQIVINIHSNNTLTRLSMRVVSFLVFLLYSRHKEFQTEFTYSSAFDSLVED